MISSIIVFSLCLIITGEVFQNHLNTFQNKFLACSDTSSDNESKLDNLLGIEAVCRQNEVGFFSISKGINDNGIMLLEICANYYARKDLCDKYELVEGCFDSVFLDSIEVVFHDLRNISQDFPEKYGTYYFINNTALSEKTITEICKNYPLSKEKSPRTISYKLILCFIWGMAFLLLLLLTWFEIQFNKKEFFIRILSGASRTRIISLSILQNSLIYIAAFFFVQVVLKHWFYLDFFAAYIKIMLLLFLVICNCLYLVLLKYNFKQIIYDANINTNLIANCYIVKTVVAIICIFLLSSGIQVINDNYIYLTIDRQLLDLDKYVFINYEMKNIEDAGDSKSFSSNTLKQMFNDNYAEGKVMLAGIGGSWMTEKWLEKPVLVYNEKSQKLLPKEVILDLQNAEEKDFYLFYPKRTDIASDLNMIMTDFAATTFGLTEDKYSYSLKEYNYDMDLLYFSEDEENGFNIEANPVLIICNLSLKCIDYMRQSDLKYIPVAGVYAMYGLTNEEMAIQQEKYGFSKMTGISVTEKCNNSIKRIVRLVLVSIISSVLMMILTLFIAAIIIKLDYLAEAKTLAIKKILGYSLIKKYLLLIGSNCFSILIGVVFNIIIMLIIKQGKWYQILECGLFMLILDFIVILVKSYFTEKHNTVRVLKGDIL